MKRNTLLLIIALLTVIGGQNDAKTATVVNEVSATVAEETPTASDNLSVAKPLDIEIGVTTLTEVKNKYPNGVEEPHPKLKDVQSYKLPNIVAQKSGAKTAIAVFDSEEIVIAVMINFPEGTDYQAIYTSLSEKYSPSSLSNTLLERLKTKYSTSNSITYFNNFHRFISKNGVITSSEIYAGSIADDLPGWKVIGNQYRSIKILSAPDWLEDPTRSVWVMYSTNAFNKYYDKYILLIEKFITYAAEIAVNNSQNEEKIRNLSPEQQERLVELIGSSQEIKTWLTEEESKFINQYIVGAVDEDYEIYKYLEKNLSNETAWDHPQYYERIVQEAQHLVNINLSVEKYLMTMAELAKNMDCLSDEATKAQSEQAFSALKSDIEELHAKRLLEE